MQCKLRGNFSLDPNQALFDILENRGVKDLENFMHPTAALQYDWELLDNIHDGIKMVLYHLHANNSICFIVDADTDGMSSAAILWLYFKRIYPQARLDYLVHKGKQHGMEDLTDLLLDRHYDLVIVPDAGSSDLEQMQMLNEVHTEICIIDHHETPYENYESIPRNTVIINNQCSQNYPNKNLCGAGMAFKFCKALDDTLHCNYAEDYVDLAALGNIADVMNKTELETNYIIVHGLHNIKSKAIMKFLAAQERSLKQKAVEPYTGLTSIDIAFYVAPLINAIVRVGTVEENINLFRGFIEPDTLVPSTKRGAAEGDMETAIDQAIRTATNCRNRQTKMKEDAIQTLIERIGPPEQVTDQIIIVQLTKEDNIIPTIRGLIASNLVEYYHRPVIIGLMANGKLQGSIRNNENFKAMPNFKAFLDQSQCCEEVAGHANSAGISIKLDEITNLKQFCQNTLSDNAFSNCYPIDYDLPVYTQGLERLLYSFGRHPEYFGNGIDEVKVKITDIPLDNVFLMGAEKNSVKITANNLSFIKFKDLDFIEQLNENSDKHLSIMGRINLNTWAGVTSVQCFIEDYEFTTDTSKFDF